MRFFGLLGKNIDYSFSIKYFLDKFEREKISDALYKNFDVPDVDCFLQIIKKNTALEGLNVTIPYKEEIIPYLDKLSRKAEDIGAVNCIKITKKGQLKGYNTDAYGFEKSLGPLLKPHHKKALVLGTGGVSRAVAYVLREYGISFKYVSRVPTKTDQIQYSDISKEMMQQYNLIINCTPLGTFPNTEECPELNYLNFSDKHIAFDLIYNPSETKFLRLAKERGAIVKNGYDMLVFQAEKAWEIWNKKTT